MNKQKLFQLAVVVGLVAVAICAHRFGGNEMGELATTAAVLAAACMKSLVGAEDAQPSK